MKIHLTTLFAVLLNVTATAQTQIGIIGGQDSSGDISAYATFVDPNGLLPQFTGGGLTPVGGIINSVAINSSGVGIIGGGTTTPYVALVAPNGVLTMLTGGGLPTTGLLNAVTINRSGAGIIGGQDLDAGSPGYAALVAPNGTLTQLSGGGFPSVTGEIRTVSINDSRVGLIGGSGALGAGY